LRVPTGGPANFVKMVHTGIRFEYFLCLILDGWPTAEGGSWHSWRNRQTWVRGNQQARRTADAEKLRPRAILNITNNDLILFGVTFRGGRWPEAGQASWISVVAGWTLTAASLVGRSKRSHSCRGVSEFRAEGRWGRSKAASTRPCKLCPVLSAAPTRRFPLRAGEED